MGGRLSYANVIATISLFLALGGGAYAATQLPKDSVTSKQIKKGSIRIDDLSSTTVRKLRGNVGPQGDRGVIGPSGASGSNRAFSTSAPWAENGPGITKIMSLALPAGSYVVTSRVSVLAPEIVTLHCFLNAAGTDMDVRYQTFKYEALLVNSAVVTLTSSGEVTEYCAGEAEYSIGQDTIGSETTLSAIAVDSVTAQ